MRAFCGYGGESASVPYGLALGAPDLAGLAQHQAVAEAPRGDVDPGHRESLDELGEDDRPGRDDIGPAAADPREIAPLIQGDGAEVLLDGGNPLPAQKVVLDAGGIVFGQAQIQGAERGDGAADPDGPIDPVPVEGLQLLGEDLPDVRTDLLQLLEGGRVPSHQPLGQANAPELEADELGAFFPLAADDLGAAAPDIHDHGTSM